MFSSEAGALMAHQDTLEAKRKVLQSILDADRNQEQRNQLGQFATPYILAREITKAALGYLPSSQQKIRFLEPSLGSGAFFSALISEIPQERLGSAVGYEIDTRFVKASTALWTEFGLNVREGDFTQGEPPSQPELATLILANPPYVRHHHLGQKKKLELQARIQSAFGRKASGLAGLYIYFMLLADRWMADDGIAAWLIPSEWADVNYGDILRDYLTSRVTLLRIHRFDAADIQFGDALVSSSVVFLRKATPDPAGHCELTWGPLLNPNSRMVSLSSLRSADKWNSFFSANRPKDREQPPVPLSTIFEVRRGIATGSNDFFIRPLAEFERMGIGREFLRPILPSAKHLKSEVICRRTDGYPDIEVPLALLDCRKPMEELESKFPAVWRYLNSAAAAEVKNGYLTSHRSPWYAQESRPSAPFLATYMGRGREGGNPFRFFWNQSDAIAPNVFLLLIPKVELGHLLRSEPQRGREIQDFLAKVAPSELIGHGRVYGGGLHKLEPKELGRLDVSELIRALGLTA